MVSAYRIQQWALLTLGVGICLALLPMSGLAATSVRFLKGDLDAFVTLVKPELTTILLDGRKGEFRPGPSLQFIGLEQQTFDINLNIGADIVDLRFHELQAQAPVLAFEEGRVRIEIIFANQEKAIRSALGAIHFRGVKAIAWLKVSSENGIRVTYEKGEIQGELKGTGLLKPAWVTEAVRKVALKVLKAQVERSLSRSTVQESIEKGFLTWAQFSTDAGATRVAPNSVSVTNAGISYTAE